MDTAKSFVVSVTSIIQFVPLIDLTVVLVSESFTLR